MRNKKKHNKISAIFRVFVIIFFSAVLGLGIYKLNATITGNDMPMPFGIGVSVVQSGSMEPTFKKGDMLFINKSDDLNEGDIVVYKTGNILVVHRIVSIDGDTIITKGDANNIADNPITKADVKGKVTGKISYVGTIVDTLRSPIGIVCVMSISVVLLIASFKTSDKDETTEELKAELEKLKQQKENGGVDKTEKEETDADETKK